MEDNFTCGSKVYSIVGLLILRRIISQMANMQRKSFEASQIRIGSWYEHRRNNYWFPISIFAAILVRFSTLSQLKVLAERNSGFSLNIDHRTSDTSSF